MTNFLDTHPITLASKSPRRKKLLEQINLKFNVQEVNTPEEFISNEHPKDCALRIAREKMAAAKILIKDSIIITADTVVEIDDVILGKPSNEDDAFKMLQKLSGRTHLVYTGFSIYSPFCNFQIDDFEETRVTFRDLEEREILDYIKTGSPMDKAGSYGIQDDFGAVFVAKIDGCYYNVVGLPLNKLYLNLKRIINIA